MRHLGRGSWLAFAVALVLSVVSHRIANADDKEHSVDIEIQGKVKDKDNKDKPVEVERIDVDAKVKAKTKVVGDCGECFISGQMFLIRGNQVVEVNQVESTRENPILSFEITLADYHAFRTAQVGDTIVVVTTITCIKDGVVECSDSDSVTIKIIEPKK